MWISFTVTAVSSSALLRWIIRTVTHPSLVFCCCRFPPLLRLTRRCRVSSCDVSQSCLFSVSPCLRFISPSVQAVGRLHWEEADRDQLVLWHLSVFSASSAFAISCKISRLVCEERRSCWDPSVVWSLLIHVNTCNCSYQHGCESSTSEIQMSSLVFCVSITQFGKYLLRSAVLIPRPSTSSTCGIRDKRVSRPGRPVHAWVQPVIKHASMDDHLKCCLRCLFIFCSCCKKLYYFSFIQIVWRSRAASNIITTAAGII